MCVKPCKKAYAPCAAGTSLIPPAGEGNAKTERLFKNDQKPDNQEFLQEIAKSIAAVHIEKPDPIPKQSKPRRILDTHSQGA